jgi:hypothetical protein
VALSADRALRDPAIRRGGGEPCWHWHRALPDQSMMPLSIKLHGPTDWTSPWRDWDTHAEEAR